MATPADTSEVQPSRLEEQLKPVRSKHRQAARESSDSKEIREACQQFEEIFLRIMLKEAHIDRAFQGEEKASNLYGDLTRETLAKALAQAGGIGMAEVLYRQLSADESVMIFGTGNK